MSTSDEERCIVAIVEYWVSAARALLVAGPTLLEVQVAARALLREQVAELALLVAEPALLEVQVAVEA